MKISHYIDRQQREQLTAYTVNEKDDFATPCCITCMWNDTGLFWASVLFREQRKTCLPPACVPPTLCCKSWKFLEFRVTRERSFTPVYLTTTFKGLLQQTTIHFSSASGFPDVTEKQSIKNAFSMLWNKNNSNNPDSEIWKATTVPSR